MLLDGIRGPSRANPGHLNLGHFLSMLERQVMHGCPSSKPDLPRAPPEHQVFRQFLCIVNSLGGLVSY